MSEAVSSELDIKSNGESGSSTTKPRLNILKGEESGKSDGPVSKKQRCTQGDSLRFSSWYIRGEECEGRGVYRLCRGDDVSPKDV